MPDNNDLIDRFASILLLLPILLKGLSAEERVKRLTGFIATRRVEELASLDEHTIDLYHRRQALDTWLREASAANLSLDMLCGALGVVVEAEATEWAKQSYAKGKTEETAQHVNIVSQLNRDLTQLNRRLKLMQAKAWRYVVFVGLLAVAVGASAWAVAAAPPGKTQITIEYNIGEIIGAILGGSGAAAAGLAYAAKTLGTREE